MTRPPHAALDDDAVWAHTGPAGVLVDPVRALQLLLTGRRAGRDSPSGPGPDRLRDDRR